MQTEKSHIDILTAMSKFISFNKKKHVFYTKPVINLSKK